MRPPQPETNVERLIETLLQEGFPDGSFPDVRQAINKRGSLLGKYRISLCPQDSGWGQRDDNNRPEKFFRLKEGGVRFRVKELGLTFELFPQANSVRVAFKESGADNMSWEITTLSLKEFNEFLNDPDRHISQF
jgi:hypothetical protein